MPGGRASAARVRAGAGGLSGDSDRGQRRGATAWVYGAGVEARELLEY